MADDGPFEINQNGKMNTRMRARPLEPRAWASVLIVIVAAACAPTPNLGLDARELAEARRVYATAFTTIAERALDPVTVRAVAVEGLRGLSAIDPAVSVVDDRGALTLALWDRDIATYDLPADTDTESWAALTAEAVARVRNESHSLRRASSERVFESVFDGALASLDAYSRYSPPEEARHNRAQRNGFGGIGILFETDGDAVIVTAVDRNGPADKAGLRIGDRITQIEDIAVRTIPAGQITDRMQGLVHSRSHLVVVRKGEAGPLDFWVTREHVVPETVHVRYEPGLAIFRVSGFNQRTAARLAEEIELASAQRGDDFRGIVLDLRGNPGGLLQQSVRAAELFLNSGDVIETRGRHPDSNHRYSATGHDMAAGRPIVVLVDGQSASAAEILAAALQDQHRAVVVGTVTYGKGSVQTVVALPNGAELSLTWSRLVTPGGYVLQGLGVNPLVCTSGTSDDGQALAQALDPGAVRQTLARAQWVAAHPRKPDEAEALRAICPPERRRSGTEMNVARALLQAPDRYASTLGLLANTATASREGARR
jgi:carboxyl-terminal processing protease